MVILGRVLVQYYIPHCCQHNPNLCGIRLRSPPLVRYSMGDATVLADEQALEDWDAILDELKFHLAESSIANEGKS